MGGKLFQANSVSRGGVASGRQTGDTKAGYEKRDYNYLGSYFPDHAIAVAAAGIGGAEEVALRVAE